MEAKHDGNLSSRLASPQWLAKDTRPLQAPDVRLFEPILTCETDQKYLLVGVAGHYSNHPDLLEQLRKVAAILSDDGHGVGTGAKVTVGSVVCSRRLRDRFFPEDLQAMIDLYRSGVTAREVAEKFGVSLRSIKRLLHQHGVRRERGGRARSA